MRALSFALVMQAICCAPLVPQRLMAQTITWPTDGWPSATPESQGVDSGVLADMLEFVQEQQLPVHSVLIVRHGRLVLDAHFYPYTPTQPHDIASATKSVTSLLVGMAIDQGFLQGVDQRISALLPSAMPITRDPWRERITIEDLLTMRSGLDCGFQEGEQELAQMRLSEDWTAFALALPMRTEPGTQYAYCSCNNHLLSAIISARTGDNALDFARKNLFEPLGIQDVFWPADTAGVTHGWGDLRLYAADLAKIAYLYLHQGRWDGRQIVSEEWVRRSITPYVLVRDGVGYGYGWWLNTTREPAVFEAVGRGGQRAAVLPDKDLVVVFNGGGVDTDKLAPFLFRAIRSDTPLPENLANAARLRARLVEARQSPPPVEPAPPPALAEAISGRRYEIEPNPLNLQHLSLTFSEGTEAYVTLRMFDGDWNLPIGLDGRFRLSSAHSGQFFH